METESICYDWVAGNEGSIDRLQQQILNAAREITIRDGFAALTMGKIIEADLGEPATRLLLNDRIDADAIDLDRLTDLASVAAFKDRLNQVLDLIGCTRSQSVSGRRIEITIAPQLGFGKVGFLCPRRSMKSPQRLGFSSLAPRSQPIREDRRSYW